KIVKCFKYWVAKRHCRLLLRCNYRRCEAGRQTGHVARAVAGESYHSAPPSVSQRSCAAAVWVSVSLSGSPAMKRPPTVETLFGRCLVPTDVGSMLSWRHGDAPFLAPIRGGLGRVCDLLTDAHRGFPSFR